MSGQLTLGLRGHRTGLISVSDLMRMVRGALEDNLGEYWVVGQVSNARLAPSNHLYFTLKDARNSVSVVMFKTAYTRLRFKIVDGMEVIVRGRVNIFEARGALQFYAEEIEPRGVGALQVAFEQLKRRLDAEGLFDQARKRRLPFLPKTIGIVTARGGAGLGDMLRILLDRYANLHVIFRPTRVQGSGAAGEIAAAIADLNRDGRAEVLIVGRGGGSLEDLWAFNEEIVARAIHRSAIPVISAVGHEIDYTIADFVADIRAPTPTAAAQIVVPSRAELEERIAACEAALSRAMRRNLNELRETIDDFSARIRYSTGAVAEARDSLTRIEADLTASMMLRLASERRSVRELRSRLRSPLAMAHEMRVRATRLATQLGRCAALMIVHRRRELGALAGQLDALSPLRVLDRGYAVVINDRDRRVVHDAASVEIDDQLDIRLARGRLRARTIARET
jgi:exodeoxyribonuclease VII large subunit